MKCEICHKAEAETVLNRKKKDGTMEELYVCKKCAHAERPHTERPSGESPEAFVFGKDGDDPPPFVEDLLKATLGFMKGIAEQGKKSEKKKDVCPACGKKRKDFMDDLRPGCPQCWHVFADVIREHLALSQYGVRHTGRAPDSAPNVDICAQLERQLKAAVRKQDFKKAAAIKRRLEELGGRPANNPPAEDK